MVLIYTGPPAYSSEGSLAEGKEGMGLHGRKPPPSQLNPTSAAGPVLTDLKAVSTETEGAVSRHDAAVAAAELMAG